MGKNYIHITIEERCEMARLCACGCSLRQIAATLDRAASTIAREMKRNSGQQGRYQPSYADQQSRARRWTGSKLDRNKELRKTVLLALASGWSPEQVAGRLFRETGRGVISHETIYRFLYAQIARTKDYSWRHLLPRGKSKRGWRGRKGGSAASFITQRRPLSERPLAANDRQTPGHWEADLMQFQRNRQSILTLHERRSRLLIAVRPPGEKPRNRSPKPCATSWHRYHRRGDRPLPSTTALSLRTIISSTNTTLRLFSVIPTRLGKKAVWRMLLAACDAPFRARRIWPR